MRALRTIPHHTFQSEPDSKGGATLAAAISKDRIIPAPKRQGKKKAPPIASYLLIGFDTEYQSIAAVDVTEVRRGEADAKNVVLSYQYNVKLVEKAGDAGRDLSVSGIIVPKDGERLAFEDFIAFAVGVWLGEFRTSKPQRTSISSAISRVPIFRLSARSRRSFNNISRRSETRWCLWDRP